MGRNYRQFIKNTKACARSLYHYVFDSPSQTIDANKDYLSIVAVIKDEAPYLVEWIEYHKLVGVTRFYLYDAATDNTREVLEPYISKGEVIYFEAKGKGVQIPCYNDFLSRFRQNSRWVAIIDADEFLAPMDPYTSIPMFLSEFEGYPAVGVNWVVYDSNGHVEKPEGLVIENYTRVNLDVNSSGNHVIKSIIQPIQTLFCSRPHCCLYNPFSKHRWAVTENYQPIIGKNMDELSRSEYVSINKIRCCHFFSKSKEEFVMKCKRGMADSNKYRLVTEDQYNFPETKQDFTMIKYVKILNDKIRG